MAIKVINRGLFGNLFSGTREIVYFVFSNHK